MANPTTTAKAQELARAWAANRTKRAELLAWVRSETDGYDLDDAVRRLLGLLDWDGAAGRGAPSYDDALELVRASRSGEARPTSGADFLRAAKDSGLFTPEACQRIRDELAGDPGPRRALGASIPEAMRDRHAAGETVESLAHDFGWEISDAIAVTRAGAGQPERARCTGCYGCTECVTDTRQDA